MKYTSMSSDLRVLHARVAAVLAAAAGLAVLPAQAIEYTTESGAATINWDTTVTVGTAFRIQDRDCNLIAVADGGCGRSPNIDDGNLNYDTGSYSRAMKVISEVQLNVRDSFGVFVRGSPSTTTSSRATRPNARGSVTPRRTWSAPTCACWTRTPSDVSISAACPPKSAWAARW
jgi:hypothetical protein